MTLFLMEFTYSSGSWARMLRNRDDREQAVGALLKALGGELNHVYWDVETGSAFLLAELPDAMVATAVRVAAIQTGAFTQSKIHELFTQSQLSDMLLLAEDASKAYKAPGQAAVERDDELLGQPGLVPQRSCERHGCQPTAEKPTASGMAAYLLRIQRQESSIHDVGSPRSSWHKADIR